MRKIAITSALALSTFLNAEIATGQSKAPWIEKEFSDPIIVPLQSIESYINETCQPSGLDGTQLLGVQTGNGSEHHLHVYCRQDKDTSARYKVTLPVSENGNPFKTVEALLENPKVRIGPFYFGKERAQDSFLLIEKTQ